MRLLRSSALLAAVMAVASVSLADGKSCTKKGCRIASGSYRGSTTGELEVHLAPFRKDLVLDQSPYHASLLKGHCKDSTGTRAHAERLTGTDPFRFRHAAAPKIGKIVSYRSKYIDGAGTDLVDTYTTKLKVHMLTAKKGKVALSLKDVSVSDAANGGGTSVCTSTAKFSIKR